MGCAPNNVTQLPEMLASHAVGDTFAVSYSKRITYGFDFFWPDVLLCGRPACKSALWSWQEVCALHHRAWTWMELCAQAQDWILQPTASDGFSFSLKLITPGGRRQRSRWRCTHLHGCLCETLHSPVTCNQTFRDVSVQRSFVDVLVKHSWWMGFLLHQLEKLFWKKVKVNALLKASIVTHIGIMEWNKMLRTKNVSA